MAKVIRVLIYEGEPETIRKTMINSILNGREMANMRITSHTVRVENCKCFSCGHLCSNTNFICDKCAGDIEEIVNTLTNEN